MSSLHADVQDLEPNISNTAALRWIAAMPSEARGLFMGIVLTMALDEVDYGHYVDAAELVGLRVDTLPDALGALRANGLLRPGRSGTETVHEIALVMARAVRPAPTGTGPGGGQVIRLQPRAA